LTRTPFLDDYVAISQFINQILVIVAKARFIIDRYDDIHHFLIINGICNYFCGIALMYLNIVEKFSYIKDTNNKTEFASDQDIIVNESND
jgi:hypothetical protein